jgi:hypothetical protein
MEFMWGASDRGSPARKSAYDSWLNSEDGQEHDVALLVLLPVLVVFFFGQCLFVRGIALTGI